MGLMQQYKKSIIGGVISVLVVGFIPATLWLHNAYADERYQLKPDALRQQIGMIDAELFVIDQEISFADDDRTKAKFIARRAYFEREKQRLLELLPK